MKGTVAKVLLTELGIPNDGFVSWPQRLEYLTQHYADNTLDYLICGNTDKPFKSAHTKRIICKQQSRISNKIFSDKRFNSFEQALGKIAAGHSFVIVCVVDSIKMKTVLHQFLVNNQLDKKVKLVFYQCGYSYYLDTDAYMKFAIGISELILLSKNSYLYEFHRYPDMPYPVHVLHNPINHNIFKPIPAAEKMTLRKKMDFGAATNFIWVSHDKPSKGLTVILEAWKLFYAPEKDVQLHIVGAKRDEVIKGVVFHGKIPNNDLPAWYQASDVFIFSPMRNEGYGLAVAEAISCGCLGISTFAGGAVDFFKEAEHGIGIDTPNFLEAWANAFDKSISDLPAFQLAHKEDHLKPPSFTSYDEWCDRFMAIFYNIEKRLL
ncbi:MAG: glycosyltransferase family 4 protein [Chitinophagaceae bacterium]